MVGQVEVSGTKLAVGPCCSWLIEVHSTLRSVGSVLLSGIYVKLGWVGLAKFGTAGTGGASPTLAVSCLWPGACWWPPT